MNGLPKAYAFLFFGHPCSEEKQLNEIKMLGIDLPGGALVRESLYISY
jgi:hypothetical protein